MGILTNLQWGFPMDQALDKAYRHLVHDGRLSQVSNFAID